MGITSDRAVAIRSFLNMWLKDPTWYCHTCGEQYNPQATGSCCELPDINTNAGMTELVIRANKIDKETRYNDFGSNRQKNIRWTVRMPKVLLRDLEKFLRDNAKKFMGEEEYNQASINGELGLFTKEYPDSWFAKNFPAFGIPRRI